jgi:Flp pilus assembly protein TadG
MFKKLRDQENGQALVEMALIFPILLILIFGAIDIGRICYYSIIVNNAARTGVRVASVGGSDSAINSAISDSAFFDETDLTVVITPSVSLRNSGEEVTVSLSYPVNLFAPLISVFLPNPYVVDANFTMRIE